MNILEFIKDKSIKYGIAWLIVTQVLAWITFFIIYFGLIFIEFDVPSTLKSWGYGPQVVKIAETGGTFALAFALNRILMPIVSFINYFQMTKMFKKETWNISIYYAILCR